ncbi:MAG: amino acid adenylation domain-containing protein [Gemmatimonadaceae bacterium]
MSSPDTLHALLERSAGRFPEGTAVDSPGLATITYGELDRLSDRVRDRLASLGVRPGNRVGIHMRKSIDAIASIFGILKCGAVYIPVDPDAPAERCAYILNDCTVSAIVGELRLESGLRAALETLGRVPPLLLLDESDGPIPLRAALAREEQRRPAPETPTVHPGADGLAYFLYTSGSTGRPKGVMLSHRNARSFVDWCSSVFAPNERDVFSSHAPLHFDLSILDVFVSLKHGATLVLISEQLGKEPLRLAPLIAEKRISVWYSTPSILNLLAQYGKLERYDYSSLRIVLFAGEVFPIPQLRALRQHWTNPRYFNLYGPTETNVCTYYELPPTTPPERAEPYPIGISCSHVRCRIAEADGRAVPVGSEGELVVSGDGVMQGYWNLPEQNARAFLTDSAGTHWYRTGDIVVEDAETQYVYCGRRDRMIKRHGYRIELGEIEAGLATHPAVKEVAVVALPDPSAGLRIKAYLSLKDEQRHSVIELKQFCTERLPRYMVPDVFGFLPALPRTSTDKINYQALLAQE